MRIADFHNDILTSNNFSVAEVERINAKTKLTIMPAWTSKMTNPIKFLWENKPKNSKVAIEDMHFITFKDLIMPASPKSALRAVRYFNPVYASLTWNNQNRLAGGALSDGNLTKTGKMLISFLQSNKILVDTAHLNRQSFWQVLEYSKGRVINSHTCFCGVFPHPRNLEDAQIRAIIERKGIVGVTTVSEFMGKKRASLHDFFNQIDYFCQKFGADSLAIGTDFNGCDSPAISDYSKFCDLAFLMEKAGYGDSVNKILFQNMLNFFENNN